jgi:hypothetical protein
VRRWRVLPAAIAMVLVSRATSKQVMRCMEQAVLVLVGD